MMLICGQTNRVWHYWAGKYPGSVGVLIAPSYGRKVAVDPWMPFVLDNDAFTAWRDKKPWDVTAWRDMLQWIRLTGKAPVWAAVPDVVADRKATLASWNLYAEEILSIGWPAAFCVQDEMTPEDVPAEASVVFVGGSDRWKYPNLEIWTGSFPRVHCARVNAPEMFEACERLGCESIDGTGWFRDPSRDDKLPSVQRFIEGHRSFSDDMFKQAKGIATLIAILLLTSCASNPFTESPRLPARALDHRSQRQAEMRQAIGRDRQAEANKSRRDELRRQMAESRTNYPPFLRVTR